MWLWEGWVHEIGDKVYYTSLVCLNDKLPDLEAEFWKHVCPGLEVGDIFTVYIHKRGKKVRTVVRRRDLGVWTQEEIDDIMAKAREEARRLWLFAE